MAWEPISEAEMSELFEAELPTLDAATRATLDRYGVPLQRVFRIFQFGPGEPDPVYVVARDGAHVLFYDDTEEEWGTATLDADGVMRDWGTYGKLLWALRQFPVPRALS